MREPVSPRDLADVALPEGSTGAVRVRETMPAKARARLDLAGPASAGSHTLHAAAVRVVRHGCADLPYGKLGAILRGEERDAAKGVYEKLLAGMAGGG